MYVKLMKDGSTHQDDLTTDHETNVLCYTGSKINQRRPVFWEAGQH